jgi:voltage-gated potassium channel
METTKFTDHVVICAWSHISQVALDEILAAGRRVAVIAEDPDDLPFIQEHATPDRLFVTAGALTAEETLKRVNVKAASTVIAAADDDTNNLIVALEIRQMNPRARIVVSIRRAELRSTLTASGVTYVASPFEMSGRLLASAAFEPEVAKFVEDVTSGADDEESDVDPGYDLQQFSLPAGSRLCNNTVLELQGKLRNINGPLLVAVAKYQSDGDYELFPHPDDDVVVRENDSIIVLGNPAENDRVSEMLGVIQGR